MIARITWFALLAAVAFVTVGVQLDRQARKTPTIAASVPEMFRSSAQLPVAIFALNGEDPEAALAEAERLVERRPMPAEHLRVLAQAQFAAGQSSESVLTIQYAAQRGWRDALAQESMLRLALENGDLDEAARRYTALFLRRDTEGAVLIELGREVLGDPGGPGRQTLTQIVSGGNRWHDQFLRRGVRVFPPDAFAEIVVAASERGTRFDCRVLRQIEEILANRDASSATRVRQATKDTCLD